MKRSAKKVRSVSSTFEGPEPPAGRRHKTIQDVRARFANLTAKQPADDAFRAAFMQSKITLAHTHSTLNLAARDSAVKSVTDRLGSGASHAFAHLIAKGFGSLLAATNSSLRTDNVGFHQVFADPNYAFTVTS